MGTLENWVNESKRRGEEIVVVLRNLTTEEEVITTINPAFVAGITQNGEIVPSKKYSRR